MRWSSSSWPSVEGTILTAEWIASAAGGRAKKTRYRPDVTYHYVVEDVEYQNDQIQMVGNSRYKTQRAAQHRLDAIRGDDNQVIVFYDPQNPSNSALQTGVGAIC